MSNWSVVVTVKADPELIDVFIQHYLKLGASEMFIYLDDPADRYIQDLYSDNSQIDIQVCDEAFWNIDYKFKNLDFVGRPDGVEDRQSHNVIHALTKTKVKWLACVDIDEFIYSERKISRILDSIPDNIFSLRIKPFEAIYLNHAPLTYQDVFATPYFKHHTKRSDVFFWNEVYPEGLIHKAGLFGHVSGKCFFRADEPLKWPGLHNFNPIDITLKTNYIVEDFKLLHFEALTIHFFIQKTLNRINKNFNVKYLDGPSVRRLENLKDRYNKDGEKGLSDAYKLMHVIDSENLKKGCDLYLIDRIDMHTVGNFDKRILITTHHTALVYNDLTEQCELVALSEELEPHLSFVQVAYDFDQKVCYLFVEKFNNVIYLYTDKRGRLVAYPFKKAMFFKLELHDIINYQISIAYENGQYFTATPKGEFKLGAKEVKAWEIFNIRLI